MFFLVLCNFCQYMSVMMSCCIFFFNVMLQKAKRRIYLDVSLTICLYPFPVLVLNFLFFFYFLFFNEKNRSVRDSYLFDKHFFGLIIMLKCNI